MPIISNKKNLIKTSVIGAVCLTLSACGAESESTDTPEDFSQLPVLSQAPTFSENTITAGDSVVVTLYTEKSPTQIHVKLNEADPQGVFSETVAGKLLTNQSLNSSETVDVTLFTLCGMDGGEFYPHVSLLTSGLGESSYSFDTSVSANNYSLRQNSSDAVDSYLAPKLTVIQPAGNDLPDLSVHINSVTKDGSTVTIDYDVTNNGARGISTYSIDFWADRAEIPTTDSEQGEARHVSSIYCVAPGQTVSNETATITTDITSGTAYVVMDRGNSIDEVDESNNVSDAYSW